MSIPNLPENDISREEAVNLILTSIAMEELGLSHILNAEGEKLQYVLGIGEGTTGPTEPPTVKDILEANKSVHQTLSNATRLQMMLGVKMESAMSTSTMQGPTGPPGLVGVILASYNTFEDLIAEHETGNQGDAYLVGGDLFVWDTDIEQWKYVGTLSGPAGPEGHMGPVGVILGSYNSLEELTQAHETGNQGDAYLVGGDLYVWNTDTEEWEWVGNLQGPQGPMGPRGLDGPEGQQGPQGEQGIQGDAGTVGTIIGSYETEEDLRTAHPTGVAGQFYYINPDLWVWDDVNDDWLNVGQIAGPQGLQGVQGERGKAGPQGPTGPVGTILGSFNTLQELETAHPIGNQGETYLVGGGNVYVWNVGLESWELVGNLSGPEGPEGPPGPQGPAGAPVEAYNFNLSASGSSGEATVGNVIFRLSNVNNTSIALSISPVSSQVLIDFARSSFFNVLGVNYTETEYHDHYSLSTSLGVDTVIYSQSNEQQKSWLRQQNPDGTWSLCEYSIFASRNAARVTLWINWIYKDLLMP